jgi:hypothetical protein
MLKHAEEHAIVSVYVCLNIAKGMSPRPKILVGKDAHLSLVYRWRTRWEQVHRFKFVARAFLAANPVLWVHWQRSPWGGKRVLVPGPGCELYAMAKLLQSYMPGAAVVENLHMTLRRA